MLRPATVRAPVSGGQPNVRAQIASGPMLIEESYLDAVCHVIDTGGQLGPGPSDDADTSMSVFAGRYDHRSRLSVTDDGIAIIGVRGLLVNRGGWLGQIWGMTSYEGLAEQVRRCADDDGIRQIVFDIDSGGGMAAGLWDLMPAIARAREIKPVTAIANAFACSAAYAIGAAAGEFYVNRSSTSGSIGVVRQHVDASGAMAKWGYRVTMFKAGAYKTAGSSSEPLTPEIADYIQAGIDDAYVQFVDHVAMNRKMDPAAVRNTEARVYGASDAVALGLADGVMNFDELIDHLRVPLASRPRPSVKTGAAAGGQFQRQERESPMTRTTGQVDAGAAPAPDLAAVISATITAMRAEASTTQAGAAQAQPTDTLTRAEAEAMATEAATRAVTADRTRTAAILGLAEAAGHEGRALQLAHETQMTVEQVQTFLAGLPKATASAAAPAGFASALANAMGKPGTSAGVKPDAAAGPDGASAGASQPSLADRAKAQFATPARAGRNRS